MLNKIETYIQKNNLFEPNAKIIVGVSGGADSVALIHILNELNYDCIIAHCNFKLRNKDSENDADFVENLALKLNLPFCKTEFDTREFSKRNKISIELAARELRYDWFEKIRIEYKATNIAVAHHANDSVETLLMNLTRGTGIRGLRSIPCKNGYVVRPLLECTRNEILGYLRKKNQNYCTDSTNSENKYTRNKFRNQIIPLFETINPSFNKSIISSIKRFEEIEKIYIKSIDAEKLNILSINNGLVHIDKVNLKSIEFSRSVLYETLTEYNFHPTVIDSIYDCMDKTPGAIFYSDTHRLLNDRDFLIIDMNTETLFDEYIISADTHKIEEPINLSISYRENNEFINTARNTATFDLEKIQFPLKLRKWEKGDSFYPLGMKSRKKISDFLVDNKINRFEKENIWLLFSGNEVIWIVNHRLDDRFKVETTTSKIIEIEFN